MKAAIVGGFGFAGGELLSLLLRDPGIDLAWVSSHSSTGKAVSDAHPGLFGETALIFCATPTSAAAFSGLDVVFFALGHGESMHLVSLVPENVVVIDLGGDFRLVDSAQFEKFYGIRHSQPELCQEFVYGLCELNRTELNGASRIANPGCFATAVGLALAPLVRRQWSKAPIIVDAKTGSSGAGRQTQESVHHSYRSQTLRPYKVFSHQHVSEILQTLSQCSSSLWTEEDLILQCHSASHVRGILASIYVRLNDASISEAAVSEAYLSDYYDEPFIRMRTSPPDVQHVRASNYCDLHWRLRGQDLIVFAAIDNLGKGAAGQALQNLNLSFGRSIQTGLAPWGGLV